jgi:hypothetical protein
MRQELVEPGPRWEAALQYLGLPATTSVSAASLADIVLAVVERLQHVEAQLATQERASQPAPWTDETAE